MPELEKGKVYWIQLVTVKKNKTESAVTCKTFRPQVAIERKPVTLTYKPAAWAPGPLVLTSDAELKIRDKEGIDHSLSIKYQTDLRRETEGTAKADGSTTSRVTFSNAKQTLSLDGKVEPRSARIQELLAQVNKVPTTLLIDKSGELNEIRPALSGIALPDRKIMSYLVSQMVQGLDSAVVPLDGSVVTAEKLWSARRNVMLTVAFSPELALVDMNYRYLGVRTINGRAEAVVKADATLRGRKGEGLNIGGKTELQASVDVESGQVVSASARIDVDLDLTEDGSTGMASGVYSVSLRRAVKAPAKP